MQQFAQVSDELTIRHISIGQGQPVIFIPGWTMTADAELYTLGGHMMFWEHAERFNRVVSRFLDAKLRDENTEWDNSCLPNTIIRGIIRDQRPSAPQPR